MGQYVCRQMTPMHRAFLVYGRPIGQGLPLVQRCKGFEYDRHHSVKT